MMRLAVFASIFALCLIRQEVSAVPDAFGYEPVVIVKARNGRDFNNGFQILQYRVKAAAANDFKAGSPIFYGVGGRVAVEDLQKQYKLFDKQSLDLDGNKKITPTIVYAEQRYFGGSDSAADIKSVDYFADLTLENVINDHIEIIKNLSKTYQTKSFLVFGGGHGGLIAGYLADKIAGDTNMAKDYNVLAWASSPPLKYIRQDISTPTAANLKEIPDQLTALLKRTGGCLDADIIKFSYVFAKLRGLVNTQNADNDFIKALKLTPTPAIGVSAATLTTDIRELLYYLRYKIINLTFSNNQYDANGNALGVNRKLRQLCAAITAIGPNTATVPTSDAVNAVLAVLDSRDKIPWKLVNNGVYNRELAAAYYQDCTQQQLLYCINGADATNVFLGSQWDEPALPCTTLTEFDARKLTECQALFGASFTVTDARKNRYPINLPNRVITTVNTDSIFAPSLTKYAPEDPSKFMTTTGLNSEDNWEFQAPQSCDTDKAKDIRYLVFRAFGCLSGFIDPNNAVCKTKLFDDTADNPAGAGTAWPDVTPTAPTCALDAAAKFPYGHKVVEIINPVTIAKKSTSTTTTTAGPGGPTKPVTSAPTTSGADSLFPMACILLSSLFMWFTAGAMI